MKEAKQFLNKYLNNNDTIVIACSGGPDSMCLVDLALHINKNIKIVVAHVNHNVREESASELLFVKKYCEDNNIIFESMKIDDYTNSNFEQEARDKRYKFFENLIIKYKAKFLLTAHHGDDLIETILMRLVRGSSLKGYSGFESVKKCKNYTILRPLVTTTKKDIIEYNKKNNIKYVLDYTNDLDVHTRNRYRKYILPRLKDEDSNVHLKFLKFSNLLLEYDSYIEKECNKIYRRVCKNDILDINLFNKLDHIIQIRIINIILSKIYENNIIYINDKNVYNIYNMIKSDKPNININLPKNKVGIKNYDKFFIATQIDRKKYKYIFDGKIVFENGMTIEKVTDVDSNSNYVCKLNSEDIKLPIIIRNRTLGDTMEVMNMKGHKKLKDIFIDSKIPLEKRDIWPIVTDSNNNILWIPGIKKSKYNKQKNEKCDIILKYY